MRRCAIYTRKSTEEGLEQDFNSLDAQREACAAFIASQKHEGWRAISARYDDGGYSGGSMERPGLQQLLADVAAGKVDVIVVYKIDRLTRALADFAKMVEIFDAHEVSFVSVTQQFNTTTSMGRLTLNVLLSFAQFEREVTAERIRDKIAASKKKGLWMGGVVPLGYDARDRKLVVNKAEAEIVRTLFRLYLELGTVYRLKQAADERGYRTKSYVQANGKHRGGKPFSRGHLYQLLGNPLYVGLIRHKDTTWPGQHEAIIDAATWDAVQERLAANAAPRQHDTNQTGRHLLTGLLFDETGDRLSPTHATKKGRRYRYYISRRLMHRDGDDRSGWRLPAASFEKLVVDILCRGLRDRSRLTGWLRAFGMPLAALERSLEMAASRSDRIEASAEPERRSIVQRLIDKVTLGEGKIAISLSPAGLAEAIGTPKGTPSAEAIEPLLLEKPVTLRRRGVETKLVVRGDADAGGGPDRTLVAMVARAHCWLDDLVCGRAGSVRELAFLRTVDESDVSRLLPLAFLAPEIVEAIVSGRQPASLTVQRLRQTGTLPLDWVEQREALGFNA